MNKSSVAIGLCVCWVIGSGVLAGEHAPKKSDSHLRRPVHTYSIVARDAKTGELGVAVQSHWFAVGSMVPWAEAGVGAIATQSFVDASYGKLGLDLMRAADRRPMLSRDCLLPTKTATSARWP